MKDRSSFWKTRFFQWKMFLKCPVYWRCGGRILQFSDDLREMKVKLPFNRKTRGLMGTHFGGALYAFVDPIPLLMLKENLGENYILWDINGSIEYVKATSQDVFADFNIGSEILDKIQGECEERKKTHFHLNILIQQKNGDVVAKVNKTIYVRKKSDLLKKRSA